MTADAGLVLLAHGGGAPEALSVGVPVVVVVVLVLLERKARRRAREETSERDSD
ncbi:MAG: hypothetical protein JWM64_2701 [Frankiales bacterium]|nr:hypothetical protein [Frankiales bacterium]